MTGPRLHLQFVLGGLLGLSLLIADSPAPAADWTHWRGPTQNGVATNQGLPESFSLKTVGKDGLLWMQPVGGRTTPLILDDKLVMITATGDGLQEGEKVVCFDANTGKLLWEHKFNVFHTDIVSSRLGWTTLSADPDNKLVYVHGTQGQLFCFDLAGKIVWQRNLTEEYGRISGYGGRIVSPLFDSGLVIVGMVNSSWGDFGPPGNRFVAFDGKTGQVAWWTSTGAVTGRTYCSNPILAVIGGQRLFITGGADGAIHGFKVRTGEKLWSLTVAAGAINPSPVVDGNLVYIAHGE
ncbi:MAG: PQQ-binding-like beta-propeller repeat protein, partial [Gemmataceae bacterium]